MPRILLLLALLLVLLAAALDHASGFLLHQHPRSSGGRSRPPTRRPVAAPGAAGVDDQQVISRAQAWIRNMVIGLRLCPFAEGVVVADTVKYVVSQGKTATEVCSDVMVEALQLVTT